MAQKVQVVLIDDLDGGEAAETVKFGLDGAGYEIDLSKKNAAGLRDALARYVAVARKGSRSGARAAAPRARGTSSSDREQNRAIRDWAKRRGLKVAPRGRIPAEVVEKYHAAAGS